MAARADCQRASGRLYCDRGPVVRGALMVALTGGTSRVIGFVAALMSAVASALPLGAAPAGESLYQALMLLFSCLTLGATLVLPRRDCTPGTIGGILFMLGSTLLAYSAETCWCLLAAWILSTVPFFCRDGSKPAPGARGLALLLSSLALALAIALIAARRASIRSAA